MRTAMCCGCCFVFCYGYFLMGASAFVIDDDYGQLETNLNLVQRTKRFAFDENVLNSSINDCSSSVEDFPQIFTHHFLKKGGVIVAILIGLYCFTLLAIVCDNYFLPCVEKICEALDLSQDVAAATFMSVATSAPELFVNLIGTFITESDIGIGTVVGSSLFNSLGVASLGGLAASAPIQLHWWPLTRDVIIYILAIVLLVGITWDGMVYWYEGLMLFIVYFVYFTIMFQNARISGFVERLVKKKKKNQVNNNDIRTSIAVISHYGSYIEEPIKKYTEVVVIEKITKNITIEEIEEESNSHSPYVIPKGSFWQKAFFFYAWPIRFVLHCTIPNPQTYPKLFPFTFIMCIFWIGSNSYIVSWMISIIGHTFRIPDTVLGLTFLAAGGCLPEAISITIMSRRGEGSMGVSNSLGANTMNILLSLGMPWFFKTIMMGTRADAHIEIDSGSLVYTISGLVIVAIILYLTLRFNKFRLSRKVGTILMSVYTISIVLAILAELVFFKNEDCLKDGPLKA